MPETYNEVIKVDGNQKDLVKLIKSEGEKFKSHLSYDIDSLNLSFFNAKQWCNYTLWPKKSYTRKIDRQSHCSTVAPNNGKNPFQNTDYMYQDLGNVYDDLVGVVIDGSEDDLPEEKANCLIMFFQYIAGLFAKLASLIASIFEREEHDDEDSFSERMGLAQ